jgi:hypothetical protein
VVQAFGAIRTVTENFYWLLSQDAVTDVYAISSGTVHEAPYFGRRGHVLAEPLYEFGDRAPGRASAGACVPVDEHFLSPAFWADVLSPLLPTHADLPAGPPPRPSRLRRSLNADWDHGFMDVVVQRVIPPVVTAVPETARR